MLKCPYCNHWNSSSAKFCENCGKKMLQDWNTPIGYPSKGIPIIETPAPQKPKGNGENLPSIPSPEKPLPIPPKPRPNKSKGNDAGNVVMRVIIWLSLIGAIVLLWMDIVSKPIAMGVAGGCIFALKGMYH